MPHISVTVDSRTHQVINRLAKDSDVPIAELVRQLIEEKVGRPDYTERRARRRKFTPEQEDYLRSRWHTTSLPDLAAEMGRAPGVISVKAKQLGLTPKRQLAFLR